jgi:Spy/CpxP family protein refolding chaperone
VKQNLLLYLVIFSLALNVGTIGTFAYLRHQDQLVRAAAAPPPLPLRSLWRQLDLNASQRQALHALVPGHRQRVGAIRLQLDEKRRELFNLIQQNATAAAIQAKVREISALQGNLEEEMVRFMLALKKNLNPQQQAAFMSRVQSRLCGPRGCRMRPEFGRFHGRHGRGPGMGRGLGPGGGPPPPPPPGEIPR